MYLIISNNTNNRINFFYENLPEFCKCNIHNLKSVCKAGKWAKKQGRVKKLVLMVH
jgi:hypothetical protein